MSGVEISFTILVDKNGHHQILPTAMDYPERFEGPPGLDNPITGGMGSISPHPLESPALLELAEETIARPLIEIMQARGILRQCVLYPGCFVSFDAGLPAPIDSGLRNQHPPRRAGISAHRQTAAQPGGPDAGHGGGESP